MRTFTERRIAPGAISPTSKVSKDGKRMGAQQRNGQKLESGQRSASEFGISRSRLGWLSIRFDGGPSYPQMVARLKDMVDQYGYLVSRGEGISGADWLQRIEASGAVVTEHNMQVIRTLF